MPRKEFQEYRGIKLMARELRKNQTSSEILAWNILRRKNISGYKFLRQHPIFYSIIKSQIDFYIADFYCAKLKLIIEVDGKIHESRFEYDKERDSKLQEKGIRVVRLKNEELSSTEIATALLNTLIQRRIEELS